MLQGGYPQENNFSEPSHGFGSNMVKQEKESPSDQTWGNKYEKPRQYRNSIGTIYIPGNSSTNANLVPLGSKSRSTRGGDNKSEKDKWHADPQARSSVEREKLWERGRAEKERQLRELQEKQAKVQPCDREAEDDSWQEWLDALEDEKTKLEKLWRGGVIGVEEYSRRRRKLLDTKVENEVKLLEKLLLDGRIDVPEFQRRKNKLIIHQKVLESYLEENPGGAVSLGGNIKEKGFLDKKSPSNKEEYECFRRQHQLDEREKTLTPLWREQIVEEELKTREKKLLEEQKKLKEEELKKKLLEEQKKL